MRSQIIDGKADAKCRTAFGPLDFAQLHRRFEREKEEAASAGRRVSSSLLSKLMIEQLSEIVKDKRQDVSVPILDIYIIGDKRKVTKIANDMDVLWDAYCNSSLMLLLGTGKKLTADDVDEHDSMQSDSDLIMVDVPPPEQQAPKGGKGKSTTKERPVHARTGRGAADRSRGGAAAGGSRGGAAAGRSDSDDDVEGGAAHEREPAASPEDNEHFNTLLREATSLMNVCSQNSNVFSMSGSNVGRYQKNFTVDCYLRHHYPPDTDPRYEYAPWNNPAGKFYLDVSIPDFLTRPSSFPTDRLFGTVCEHPYERARWKETAKKGAKDTNDAPAAAAPASATPGPATHQAASGPNVTSTPDLFQLFQLQQMQMQMQMQMMPMMSMMRGMAMPGMPFPGMPMPGMPPPGAQMPGMSQPGAQMPGMPPPAMPGMPPPGVQMPGMPQPGAQMPGMQPPGVQMPGMPQPGAQMPDTQSSAAQMPSMPQRGAQMPGMPQPGTQMPDTQSSAAQVPSTPSPGMPMPDAHAAQMPEVHSPDAPLTGMQTPNTWMPHSE